MTPCWPLLCPNDSYIIRPWLENERVSSSNDAFNQAKEYLVFGPLRGDLRSSAWLGPDRDPDSSGNPDRLTTISFRMPMNPQNKGIAPLNIFPSAVRERIEKNYANQLLYEHPSLLRTIAPPSRTTRDRIRLVPSTTPQRSVRRSNVWMQPAAFAPPIHAWTTRERP